MSTRRLARPTAIWLLLILAAASPLRLEADTAWSEPVPTTAARADLAALYQGLKAAHYDLFAHRTQVAYDAKFAEIENALSEPVSRFELFLRLQRFAAYGNVAHARIDFPGEVYGRFREGGGRAFPIYPRIVAGRSYVAEDYSGSADIDEGDEILTLNGLAMGDWLERCGALISADTPYIAHSLLEQQLPVYLWALVGERDGFDLELRKTDGRRVQTRIAALSSEELGKALDAAPARFELDYSSRGASILDGNIAYLRPGPFYNVEDPEQLWNTDAFIAFVDDAFERFMKSDARSLILDLRSNPGGDNSFSDPIISWFADRPFRFASSFRVRSSDQAAEANQARLDSRGENAGGVSALYAEAYRTTARGEVFDFEIPIAQPRRGSRFDGEVYVLVNRNSYSNAVTVAALIQDYGWGIIAGEETADFATTYGAMERFTLPASGFSVGFPKAKIVRPSGDEQVGGVRPDLPIESPLVAPANDVVLEQLIAKIGEAP